MNSSEKEVQKVKNLINQAYKNSAKFDQGKANVEVKDDDLLVKEVDKDFQVI